MELIFFFLLAFGLYTLEQASAPLNMPQRLVRLKPKIRQNLTSNIKLLNRFETKRADSQKKSLNKSVKVTSKAVRNKMKASDTIFNISSTKLSESEISLLNKGSNFCPKTTEPNKEQHFDQFYFFCQKLKLK